jgi:hypothetical protein
LGIRRERGVRGPGEEHVQRVAKERRWTDASSIAR